MSNYDNKAESEVAVAHAAGMYGTGADTAYWLASAQAHATLHLANQQRIANLLAYQALHPNSHTDLDNSVADQITEAMGA